MSWILDIHDPPPPVQISVNPTYHMVGKHAHNIGKDVIQVDKNGKVKLNADQA